MVPVLESTAISGRPLPVRTARPVSGSLTASGNHSAMSMGCDHVSPASPESITDSVATWGDGCTPEPWNFWNMSTRVPSGSTAIWLPIVKMF
jgi:hypothetical protein